ncbi:NB-ARC domain-containing protein [Sorangium sp. So ce119]|uniref:NB-ARC domain-containing protein n=1 Tax=Sorangium sp. So ce119 TaxID=3133279 RepID=UPI003F5D8433
MASPVSVVILYAAADTEHHDALRKHLAGLERRGVLATWSSQKIAPGDDWQKVTREHLAAAHVVLLLLSADFIAGDLDEMVAPVQSDRLLPIRVRDFDWDAAPFRYLRSLPANGKPVTQWPDRDKAWAEIAEEVRLLIDPSAPRLPSSAAPFHVPFAQDKIFFGREDELTRLHALLQKGGTVGVRPAALTGMGGIGKTQLAAMYAHRYRDSYAGGVYWVNAAGDDWRPALADLAVKLDLEARDAPEAERQIRLIAALDAYLRARPDALVIFDNVDRPADLASDRRAGLVPMSLGVHLLFTSRRRDEEGRFGCVEVSVLPEDAALELLLSSTARRPLWEARATPEAAAEIAAARAICEALGALPLAVALAAAFLGKNPKVTLAGYSARIAKHGALPATDTNKVVRDELATLHEAGVEATLASQWEALQSEDARLALRAAALLGEAAEIPRARLSLLTGLEARADEGFAAALDGALQELAELSLAEMLVEKGAVRLHPLVRAFAMKRTEARAVFAAWCADRLGKSLRDMGRLHAEVAERGIDAVLGDLRAGVLLADASGRERLDELIRPLDREAHALREWDAKKEPVFLLQQLRNRCFATGVEEVQKRAEARLAEQGWPWLRERVRTNRESDALVRTLEGRLVVMGVAVTPDGRAVISASADGTLKMWDLGTGLLVRTLEGHTGRVDGVTVTADGRFAVSASSDKTLKIWDLSIGQVVRTLAGHTDNVTGVAVTPDGRFAVSASADKTLKIWDLSIGQVVRTLEGHTDQVTGVAVTPDGLFAVSVSSDETLKVWDLSTGQVVRTLGGNIGLVEDVAVTPDGCFAVSASSLDLTVWDLRTGRKVRTLMGHIIKVTAVAVTPDGGFAVSASRDKTLKVWDLRTGQFIRTLEGHSDWVHDVAVTPDGRFAVSAALDGILLVWDLRTAQAVRVREGHTKPTPYTLRDPYEIICDVAVTPDGHFAVSASFDETLKVWDLSTGQVVRTLEGHTRRVTDVTVTENGLAVSASEDKTLKVWDLSTGKLVCTLEGHTDSVEGVAVTADGCLAVSASRDKTMRVWDLRTGNLFRTLEEHTEPMEDVAVTLDGRFAVSTLNPRTGHSDCTLKVWDLGTGKRVRNLEGHTWWVNKVQVTADGGLAVSTSDDCTLKVWEVDTWKLVRTLDNPGGNRDVAVTPDGRLAVSFSRDRMILWSFVTGEILGTMAILVCCCAIAPDGRTIIAGDELGALRILDWVNPSRHCRAEHR